MPTEIPFLRSKLPFAGVLVCGLALWLTGCRSVSDLSPANLSEPGWKVQQGQAVWRSQHGAPEIAGELLVATHADGRSLVQFTKPPLPMVLARTSSAAWQIDFAASHESLMGWGPPPSRFVWLHLAKILAGATPPSRWAYEQRNGNAWRLENPVTGESLEGDLSP